ncbi:MAG: type II toxin-antitoxin system HicA family toxin [Asticcacaulis sp.]
MNIRRTQSPKDIARRLNAEGYTEYPAKGDHRKFKKPGKDTVVLDMGVREIPIGTLRNIYRQAGWTW